MVENSTHNPEATQRLEENDNRNQQKMTSKQHTEEQHNLQYNEMGMSEHLENSSIQEKKEITVHHETSIPFILGLTNDLSFFANESDVKEEKRYCTYYEPSENETNSHLKKKMCLLNTHTDSNRNWETTKHLFR